jgi:hypothetical protein
LIVMMILIMELLLITILNWEFLEDKIFTTTV